MKQILAYLCACCPLCILRRSLSGSKYARFMERAEKSCPACKAYKEYVDENGKSKIGKKNLIVICALFWFVFFGIVVLPVAPKYFGAGNGSVEHEEGLKLFTDKEEYLKIAKSASIPSLKIHIHKVRNGENYWKIAKQYGVNIDTIIGANPYLTGLLAKNGEEIVVPDKKGALQVINSRKDLAKISQEYGVDENKIRSVNNLSASVFEFFEPAKTRLIFIPDVKPKVLTKELSEIFKLREMFNSPLAGRYTSFYGFRKDPFHGAKTFHNGVDIAVPMGAPVSASAEGIVIYSGWLGGYGNTIKIQHKNSYITLYGHCSKLLVSVGKKVKKGQIIAKAGSTGRSTGCHLHFTVWQDGKEKNPLLFLW